MKYVWLPLLFCLGCATQPMDYTNFRKFHPRSILVIPPLNNSTDIKGIYSCLASVTQPIAEMGYYVFPVVVIDEFLKENGMPTPGEMHQIPLKKVSEIINADAVLYITIENYGTKFQVLASNTQVTLKARLVDTKTGTLLWSGANTQVDSGDSGSGGLTSMLVYAVASQIINSSTDRSHQICRMTNSALFTDQNRGLLRGPYFRE